jgi:hypothetical protein
MHTHIHLSTYAYASSHLQAFFFFYILLASSFTGRKVQVLTRGEESVQAALFRPPVVDSVESIEAQARLVEQLQQPPRLSAP